MNWFRADLHIHSVLSACASLDMSPRRLVQEARRAGLDLIAVCDHNACANGCYTRRAARGRPVVLAGMEIQTQEEVEVLAWFEDAGACQALAQEFYDLLPDIPCRPDLFGDQVVVDERDEIMARLDRLLLSPVPLTLEEVVHRVEGRGGIAVPAHVDRVPGGLLAVLGMLPPGDWPQAVEIAPWTPLEEVLAGHPEIGNKTVFRSSDAHFPDEIGRGWTELYLTAPTFEELRAAIFHRGRRRVRIGPEVKEG